MNLAERNTKIIHLLKLGQSQRQVAKVVGCSKSTVQAVAQKETKGLSPTKAPKILLFDLENAPSIVAAFQRFNVNIGPDSVITEGGFLLSACWKFLDETKITKMVLTPQEAIVSDDSRIVAALYEAFEKADIVVAHNGRRFDVPLFKTRLIANGMPPPKTVKIIDTLQIAKKLKFNSNKLDSLGHYLEVGRKIPTEGMSLWLRCMDGDRKALSKMLEYNEQDVILLEEVYLKLRAFDLLPPNLAVFYDDDTPRCPACGSVHLTTTGNSVYTSVSKFEEIVCDDCGHRSRTRKALNSTNKRKTMLASPKA
jgi:transcriptional regulator with XRE-family HTH domain